MRFIRLMLIVLVVLPSIARAQETNGDTRSLGEIARELRANRERNNGTRTTSTRVAEMIAEMSLNSEDDYEEQMRNFLDREDFPALESAAASARAGQSRFTGGVWKLFTFYETASTPAGGLHASEYAWEKHLEILKRWRVNSPSSTTARIALAQGYLRYGQKARGAGYSDSVSEEGWEKLELSTNLAESALREAAALPNKCPHYYATLLEVALLGGWSKSRTRAVFDEAISFEPGYYHYYRLYANYLQTKWYGAPGEVEAFANQAADRIGGTEGDFIYFEIATLLGCGNCGTASSFRSLSWPRVKNGYSALESRYGTSPLKMNRFAYLAALVRDREAAEPVFVQIGERWNRELWRTREKFEVARSWALGEAP